MIVLHFYNNKQNIPTTSIAGINKNLHEREHICQVTQKIMYQATANTI